MKFAPEPRYEHGKGQAIKTAILYCNLGTPDAPTPKAVRRFLAEFLSDSRVVELPRLPWLALLYAVILPRRGKQSAHKYESIWTENGSPLLHWTKVQAHMLEQLLQHNQIMVRVVPAMRYGNPSIAAQLQQLKTEGVENILVFPAYPQYSGTTTASINDAVNAWAAQTRNLPELRFIKHYHDHPAYIQALADSIFQQWRTQGRGQHLLMSFHGVPERTLQLGDPYHCESQKTARLLAQALGLKPEQYSVSFQSRFGKAKWLEPSTVATLHRLVEQKQTHIDVVCPGFSADCLETLEEIQIEARTIFIEAGGESLHYIPCLNDNVEWIQAMGHIARQHLAGWPVTGAIDHTELLEQKNRYDVLVR